LKYYCLSKWPWSHQFWDSEREGSGTVQVDPQQGRTNRRRQSPKGLPARVAVLEKIEARLAARITAESAGPRPDPARLERLARLKRRTTDEIASIQGLVRALDRGRVSRVQ
jgi:hypothetical protein